MKFPYFRYGVFYRPVVPVVFKFGDRHFPYRMLLDTGADISLVHSEIAEQLGIKLAGAHKIAVTGVAGRGIGHIHILDLVISKLVFTGVPVVFCRDIPPYTYGIMGH